MMMVIGMVLFAISCIIYAKWTPNTSKGARPTWRHFAVALTYGGGVVLMVLSVLAWIWRTLP